MKATDDYVPYGDEWVKELMKLPKAHIIGLYKERCLAYNELGEKRRRIYEKHL